MSEKPQKMGLVRNSEEEAKPSSSTSDMRGKNPEFLANVGRGRKPGQVNKITKTFKEAAERAFEEGGGVDWLVRMMNGTASDRAAVMGLFGRLIPAQLQAQVDTTVRVELNWLGNRGIGRVTEEDIKSLDKPQNLPGIQDVIEGEIVQQPAGQPMGNQVSVDGRGSAE